MTSQLKHCPFCGGDGVSLARAKQVFDNSIGYIPLCADCGCTVGSNIDAEFTAYTDFHTEAEAIDAWNTRAERTCRMETEESCQNWNSCSECDADYYTDQPINYCPNCGAKVVEE